MYRDNKRQGDLATENAGREKRDFFHCEWVKVDHEASETCCCPFVEVRKTDWSPGGMRGVAE